MRYKLFIIISLMTLSAVAQKKSDRQNDGLRGNVKSVVYDHLYGYTYDSQGSIIAHFEDKGARKFIHKYVGDSYAEIVEVDKKGTPIETEIRLFDKAGHSILNDWDLMVKGTYSEKKDAKGNVTERLWLHKNKALEAKVSYLYDAQGNITMLKIYTEEETYPYYQFKYNSEGKLIAWHIIRPSNKQWQDITYHPSGNIAKDVSYDPKGKLNSSTHYTYNSKGQLIQELFTMLNHKNVKETDITLYKYDSKGNNIEIKHIEEGKTRAITTMKYNTQGDMTEMVLNDISGHTKDIITYVYKYDSHNNWIEEKEYKNGKEKSITKRTIKYY